MDKDEIIKQLQEENSLLKNELESTQNHLKKYTAPARNKKHYEANKEIIKSREYKQSVVSSEKKKEYARQAYLNKKEKMKKLKENENI
tara:strand:- start:134 stop:397 length:264 start_codon:yes stop_codon:yes gene_type:complete